MSKPKTIVYDLDGVIVDSSERLKKHIITEFKESNYAEYLECFKRYARTTDGDVKIDSGVNLVESLIQYHNVLTPFALTSRGECGRIPTYAWILAHTKIPLMLKWLIMRPEQNGKDDVFSPMFDHVVYKREQIQKIMEDYDILYAIDDHPDICVMYRSLGIPTIRFMMNDIDCLAAAGDKSKEKF